MLFIIMSKKNESLCSKLMNKICCLNCFKSKPNTLPKIPKDIAEVLSDVNIQTDHNKPEFVNKITNEYKSDYGTRVNTTMKKESPKKESPKNKIKLSIDNDYIRKSSDNLHNVTSPRPSPQL